MTYRLDGKRITTALKDSNGNPITDKAEAEAERKRIMAPYLAGAKVETLRAVQSRIVDAQSQHQQAIEESNPPPELDTIWTLFLESPTRPDSGENTLRVYSFKWSRFRDWLRLNHPAADPEAIKAAKENDTQKLNAINHPPMFLHEVSAELAAAYVRDLNSEKLSASTFNQHRNLLRMVWRVMTEQCRLSSNPWDKVTPRKLNQLETRKRALTQSQYDALLQQVSANPDLHDLFTVLAWTGLRLADAVLLKWCAVDFPSKVISLAPIKTARRMGKVVHIPMFPKVMEVLNRRQEGKVLNPKAFVFPELALQYHRDASAISKAISKTFDDAGMKTTEQRADRGKAVVLYGAHSLRHYFVTAATAAGMPAAMIKSITGHSSDGMLEHYQQIGVSIASDLAKRIEGASVAQITVGEAQREPLPAWAHELVRGMTAKTWKNVKMQLLKE